MSVIGSNLIAGASGQGGGYNLTNSLRFRSSASAFLNRTPSTNGNQKVWTYSAWVKRGSLSTPQWILGGGAVSTDYTIVRFGSGGGNNDNLEYVRVVGSAVNAQKISTAAYRDPSAWYHIVVTEDAINAVSRVYVNGNEITYSTNTNPTNSSGAINAAVIHNIGRYTGSNIQMFDGYMAEVHLIDGQALTPSSFGETSTTTGVWIPKKYTGTYGTNGFYLPFTDNSALTTSSNVGLGRDYSGNGNYWTTNNISITAGITYDSMTDVPTLTSATTANFAVMNPNWKSSTASTSNANLTVSQTGALDVSQTTMGVSSGKWYWETTITSIGSTPSPMIGVVKGGGLDSYTSANGYYYWSNSGQKFNNGTAASYGATYTTNDVIGVALDMDAGTLTFYKNNTSQGTAYSGLSGTFSPTFTNGGGPTISWSAAVNFGQRPFAYTPPTGFNKLNTFNLPTPTIGATASTLANKNMDISLYTGTGATQSIVNSGGMQPDLVWIKARSIAYSHVATNSVVGATKFLVPNGTDAEYTQADTLTSFNSNGFSLGADATYLNFNANTRTYVAWQWKAGGTAVTNTAGSISAQVSANASAGFSVVTWTGNATSGATVGHGLGVKPSLMILFNRSIIGERPVYSSVIGAFNYLYIQATNASAAFSGFFNNTEPTSSVFTIGSDSRVNGSGNSLLAYCFSEVAGYSKFGSYTGNGSADGTFVYTGFRPRYVMVKRIDGIGHWIIKDTARNSSNVTNANLYADLSNAEDTTASVDFDLLSNGFKLRGTYVYSNASGGTYIYMAFAEFPFRYSLAR